MKAKAEVQLPLLKNELNVSVAHRLSRLQIDFYEHCKTSCTKCQMRSNSGVIRVTEYPHKLQGDVGLWRRSSDDRSTFRSMSHRPEMVVLSTFEHFHLPRWIANRSSLESLRIYLLP